MQPPSLRRLRLLAGGRRLTRRTLADFSFLICRRPALPRFADNPSMWILGRRGIGHVRDEVDKLCLNAKWTLTAAAREYRETLAIERAIKDDPVKREAWVKRQLELEPVNYLEEEAEAAVST